MKSVLKCCNYSLSVGLLVWIFLGLFTVAVSDFATGADSALCANMTPSNADPQDGASPYTIELVNDPEYYSSSVQIRIQGPAYEGIILQARANDTNDDTPLGTFSGESLPADTKLLECSAANDTVTHSSITAKTNESTYEWIAGDVTDTIKFVATIWENETVFYVQLESDPLDKDPADSISPTSTMEDMSTSDDDNEVTTSDDDDMMTTSDDDDEMSTSDDDNDSMETSVDDDDVTSSAGDDDDMSTSVDDNDSMETESEDMETSDVSPSSTDDTPSATVDVNATTTTTTTTTTAPPTPAKVEVNVPVSLSLNETFNENLTDTTSQEYMDKTAEVIGPLNETLSQTPGFVEIYNVRYAPGSIVVTFLVRYEVDESTPSSAVSDATALQNQIKNAVEDAITNGTLNLNIIADSLEVTRKVTCPSGYMLVIVDDSTEECQEDNDGNGDDNGSVGIGPRTHIVAVIATFLIAFLFSR